MLIGNWDTNYKTPEERKRLKQLKKHKETCAKNRSKRKRKNKKK